MIAPLRNPNYPPFADPALASKTMLERAQSRGSLHSVRGSQAHLGLAPITYYRQRPRFAHANPAALSNLPAVPKPKPKPRAAVVAAATRRPRNERHMGQINSGLREQWEGQLSQKYASLYEGVNTAKAFERIDKNRDGVMDREEVLKAMLGASLNVSAADLDRLMHEADTNGDGHLSFEEFENGIMKLTSHEFTQGRNLPKYKMGGGISMGMDPATAQKQNRSATNTEIDEYVQALRNAIDKKYTMLYKAFAAIDTDNSQYLSFNELKAVCEKFQLPIPVTHVQEVFYQIFDKDGDGRVSYKEFCDKLNEWESQKQS